MICAETPFYVLNGVQPPSLPPAPPPQSTTPTSTTSLDEPTNGNVDDRLAPASSSDVIIGVVVGLGGGCIICGVLAFVYAKYRRRFSSTQTRVKTTAVVALKTTRLPLSKFLRRNAAVTSGDAACMPVTALPPLAMAIAPVNPADVTFAQVPPPRGPRVVARLARLPTWVWE
ncbi:hypothetical protein T492DRAFT_1029284 [Pavlovales sp. CCMP2436]|nr:hypothetical protein T492DRAFT_1029284 [Pavlovales sp. CCMP2436]